MIKKSQSAISRREFAKRAAVVSAAASLAPETLLPEKSPNSLPLPDLASSGQKLSPESQKEVDSRIHAILSQYGSRLSDAQKSDIRRLAAEAQPPLDRLRSYVVENGDDPALYLKPLIEHEKKPALPIPASKSTSASKNS